MFKINQEKDIQELLEKETPTSLLREYKNTMLFIIIASTVSFLASFNTLNNIMGGWGANFDIDLNKLGWENGFNALIAAGICIIIVKAQSTVFTKRTYGLLATIIFLIIAIFNIATETGNASSRAERGMREASQQTPSFLAAQRIANETNLNPIATPSPLLISAQREISVLNGKIKRCEEIHEKEADQKWCARKPQKQLIQARADLEAAQSMMQQQQQQMAATATAQVEKAQEQLQQLEANENYYHPLIKIVKEAFGVSGFIASVATGLGIVIVMFFAFLFLGQEKEALKEALRRIGFDTNGNPLTPPKKAPEPPQQTKPEAPKPPQNQIKESNQIDLEDLVKPGQMNDENLAEEPKKDYENQDLDLAENLADKVDHAEDRQGDVSLTRDQFLAVLRAIDTNQLKRFSYSSVGKVLKENGASKDNMTLRYLVELTADGMMRDNIIITNPKFEHNEAGKGGGTSKWIINPNYQKQPNRWH